MDKLVYVGAEIYAGAQLLLGVRPSISLKAFILEKLWQTAILMRAN